MGTYLYIEKNGAKGDFEGPQFLLPMATPKVKTKP